MRPRGKRHTGHLLTKILWKQLAKAFWWEVHNTTLIDEKHRLQSQSQAATLRSPPSEVDRTAQVVGGAVWKIGQPGAAADQKCTDLTLLKVHVIPGQHHSSVYKTKCDQSTDLPLPQNDGQNYFEAMTMYFLCSRATNFPKPVGYAALAFMPWDPVLRSRVANLWQQWRQSETSGHQDTTVRTIILLLHIFFI